MGVLGTPALNVRRRRTMGKKYPISVVLNDVQIELASAIQKHGSMMSIHHGYAVILEELDELWDEVKEDGSKKRMREEAIQIASSAVRFVLDLCQEKEEKEKEDG